MDLEEIFMEDEERREVKQMKSSLVPLLLLLVVVRWGLSLSDSIDLLLFLSFFSMSFGHF